MRLHLAEDDSGLSEVLARGLTEAGYVVDVSKDGESTINYLKIYDYSLIILDWNLPKMNGLEIVTFARRNGLTTPILMLTARDQHKDRIAALDAGADDYLIKPFDFGELVARTRALLRRGNVRNTPVISVGNLTFDPEQRTVTVSDSVIELAPREFAILEILLRRSPNLVSRSSIAENGWGDEGDAVGSNTIDVHIARLRSKLVNSNIKIVTLRGVGYKLVSR